jgi:VanZ family protein
MKTKLLTVSYFLFLVAVIYCADSRAHLHLFSFIRSVPGGDKVGHFLLMGTLALLLNLALSCRVIKVAGRAFLIGSLIALTLITIEEFSQRFVPYRTFDLVDLVADYSGVIIFSWLAVVIRRNYYGRSEVATDLH